MSIYIGADVVLANLSQGNKTEVTFEDINAYCKKVKEIFETQGELNKFLYFAVNNRDLQDAVLRYPNIFSIFRERFTCKSENININDFNDRYIEEVKAVLLAAAG